MDAKDPAAPKRNRSVNYVHQSEIRAECIRKEKKYEGVNFKYDYTFQPKNLYPYAEKPQSVAPNRPYMSNDTMARLSKREYQLNKDPINDAFVKDRIMKSIIAHQQIPKDKYDYPMTSAQEVGWFSKPLVDNRRWNHPVKSTPISNYVNSYFITNQINPFKLKSSSLKMK